MENDSWLPAGLGAVVQVGEARFVRIDYNAWVIRGDRDRNVYYDYEFLPRMTEVLSVGLL